MDSKLKILFCGGATGGHLFPAVAIAEEFEKRYNENNLEIMFIGSNYGIESRIVPKYGYQFKKIWIRGIQRGWSLREMKINILAPFRILISLVQSLTYIQMFKPDLAIGTGGYSSGPPLYIAEKIGTPVFLQEQNVYPGVTNRILAKKAERVYTAYESSKDYFSDKCDLTNFGMPLRNLLKSLNKKEAAGKFKLSPNRKIIFVFGGSQGAEVLNEFLNKNVLNIIDDYNCQFIWQTGKGKYDEYVDKYSDNGNIYLTPFIENMGAAYSASDIIVSRAGALSIAEICSFGKPSILVPLPGAAENHQEKNAKNLEKHNAAKMILEENLNRNIFSKKLNKILKNINQMKKNANKLSNKNATEHIVNDITTKMGLSKHELT